jgi:predicted XRE-type DNA-binding protein
LGATVPNRAMSKLPKFEKSSGNVFADLGLPQAEELLLKAQITVEIRRAMKLKKSHPSQSGGTNVNITNI